MTTENRSKLNKLINSWPKGTVHTSVYLKKTGFSYDLVRAYRKSAWIEQIGTGAYKLFGDNVEWYGALYTLQQELGIKIHLAGKTALALKGFAHYISENISSCFLLAPHATKLPKWFKDKDWKTEIVFVTTNLFPKALEESFSKYKYHDFSIRISTAERAIMELVYFIPEKQGFDEALKIMENLVTLRPELVQILLEKCNSVKVKRVFMYLAEKVNHPWVNHLKPGKVNFGSGERQVLKNGYLDKKYKITVPKVN